VHKYQLLSGREIAMPQRPMLNIVGKANSGISDIAVKRVCHPVLNAGAI